MLNQQPQHVSMSDAESPAKRMRIFKPVGGLPAADGDVFNNGGDMQRTQNYQGNFQAQYGGNTVHIGGLPPQGNQAGVTYQHTYDTRGGYRTQTSMQPNTAQTQHHSNYGPVGLSPPICVGQQYGGSDFQRPNPFSGSVRMPVKENYSVPPPTTGDQHQQPTAPIQSLLNFEGRFCDEAKTQNGSKILIDLLTEGKSEHLRQIFLEIVECFDALATNASGNRVLQTLFDHCSVHQKDAFFAKMSGKCMNLASNPFGSFVLQKAFETFPPRLRCSLANELRGEVVRLSYDQNGNHLVQRVIESVNPVFIKFIVDELVVGGIGKLALQQSPVRVIQRVLEYFEGDHLKPLVNAIRNSLSDLSGHQYGNYVAQAVFESKLNSDQMLELVQQVSSEILTMSKRKFANYTVEKCLKAADPIQTTLLIDGVLKNDGAPFLDILQDPYGNYVAQEMLEKASADQRAALAALIRSHERELKLNVHARGAITKYQNLLNQVANSALVGQAPGSTATTLIAYKGKPTIDLEDIVKQLNDPITSAKKRLILRIQLQADPSVTDELMVKDGGRVALEETLQNLAEVAVDSAGAAFLKAALDDITDDVKEKFIAAMVSIWPMLVYDVNGNYVVQKLIDISTEHQLMTLLVGMQSDFLKMSRNICGSHVVQKMLGKVTDYSLRMSMVGMLKGQVVAFATDRTANYVLQRVIEVVPVELIGFLADEIRGYVTQLTTSAYGSKFLQTFLKCVGFTEEQRRPLIDEFCSNAYDIATNVQGNFLLQIILEFGYPKERQQLIRFLINIQGGDALVLLAQHKYACHVIVKCLEFADAELRAKICASFCAPGGHDLGQLMVDPYASFIILKLLEVSDTRMKMALSRLLKPHFEVAKTSQNAATRSVCSKMESFFRL